MTPFPDVRRIEDLERDLAVQEEELRLQLGIHEVMQGKRWQFLVETVAGVSAYPASGDTFAVRFLDIAWDGTPGLSGYTPFPRAAAWQAVVKNVSGEWLPQGTVALATFHPPPPGTTGKGKWIVNVGQDSNVKRFRLTADLSTGGNAAANVLSFNGTTYVTGAACYVFDWYSLTAGAPGLSRGMWQGKNGMEGIGLKREVPSVPGQLQYDIIWMEEYAWDCEVTLTSDPTFSGTDYASSWTATADVDKSFHQGVSPGSSITIHDDQNMFPFAKAVAKAKVIRTEHEGSQPYYKVVACQQLALYGTATLSGALCGSTPASVRDFTRLSPSPFNLLTAVISASNPRGHAGVHGDEVHLMFDGNPSSAGVGTYYITDVEHHAVGVLKEFAISSNGLYLQGCYRTIYTEICDNTTYCTDLLHLRNFNWWCSGNYYQYCSGSGAGSGSGGSGSGATGGDTICGCQHIGDTFPNLTCQIWYPGSCWHGQSVNLAWNNTTKKWVFTGAILGDTWTIELRCSGDLVSGSTLHVEAPACITGAPGDLSGPGSSYSCDPVLGVYRYYTKSSNTGCSSCANSSTPEYWEFRVSS